MIQYTIYNLQSYHNYTTNFYLKPTKFSSIEHDSFFILQFYQRRNSKRVRYIRRTYSFTFPLHNSHSQTKVQAHYGRGEYLLQRSLLRDGDMDLLRLPFELSGGEVGVFCVSEASEVSGNGVLVNLVNRENIPRFGSHWKYRHPATDPSFLPEGSIPFC